MKRNLISSNTPNPPMDKTSRGGYIEILWGLQAEFSEEAFGSDSERGPTGPLNHLLEEVEQKLLEAPEDITEYADAFLLLVDALRRAGFSIDDLLRASMDKIKVNKNRDWGAPDKNGVYRHIKEEV